MSGMKDPFIHSIRSAAPYIHAYRGKTFVLQMGGDVLRSNAFPTLIHDIALLNRFGIRLVIVFGVRPQIAELLRERGIESTYAGNLRVSDGQILECVKQAVSICRIDIEALFSMGLPYSPMFKRPVRTASGNFVTAKPAGIVHGIDLKFTGKVRRIDREAINARLEHNEIVLVSSLGYSLTGEVFNLSSVEVATQCAIELSADKLIFVLPEAKFVDDGGEVIRQLTQEQAQVLLDKGGLDDVAGEFLASGISACSQGVNRTQFIPCEIDGAVLQELFSRDGIGTLLSVATFDEIRQATIADIAGILELLIAEEGVLVQRTRKRLEEEIDHYSVLLRDKSVIACGALYCDEVGKIAEVAGLVIAEEYRNESKGKQLLAHLEKNARKAGMQKLFVLTTHAAHWFQEQGFTEADIDDLPIARQQLYNDQRNSKVLIRGMA